MYTGCRRGKRGRAKGEGHIPMETKKKKKKKIFWILSLAGKLYIFVSLDPNIQACI